MGPTHISRCKARIETKVASNDVANLVLSIGEVALKSTMLWLEMSNNYGQKVPRGGTTGNSLVLYYIIKFHSVF